MTGLKTIAIAAALAGCASVHRAGVGDLATGHWTGEIDRGDWLQPFALELDSDAGTYRGEWRSALGLRSELLQNFDVDGEAVRFETDQLLFRGRVQGRKLSGTVSRKDAGVPDAKFTVTHDDSRLRPDEEPISGEMH